MTMLIIDGIMVEVVLLFIWLVGHTLMTSRLLCLLAAQPLFFALLHEALQIVIYDLNHVFFEPIANYKVAHELHEHLVALLAVAHDYLASFTRRHNNAEASNHLLGSRRFLCRIDTSLGR